MTPFSFLRAFEALTNDDLNLHNSFCLLCIELRQIFMIIPLFDEINRKVLLRTTFDSTVYCQYLDTKY
jgi:hypothetical protein